MTRVALLIGVSQYEDESSLQPLPAAEMDVQAIAKVLQHREKGGFKDTNVRQLINPDPRTMCCAIEALLGDRQPEDLVLLYFSGHAIAEEGGKLHLATRITQKTQLQSTAVSSHYLLEMMAQSLSQQQILILDCCSIGNFESGEAERAFQSFHGIIQTHMLPPHQDTATFEYSCKQKEADTSMYTHYLVEGLETGAADRDNDGAISLYDWHSWASNKVQTAAPALKPAIYGLAEGDKILLAKTPLATPQLRYRQTVEDFAKRGDGEISFLGLRTLDIRRERLGVLPEEAAAIFDSVLAPYREYKAKLQQYEQVLMQAVKQQGYWLPQETRAQLLHLQREVLGLRDRDIAHINARRLSPPGDKTFPFVLGAGVILILAIGSGIHYLVGYITSPIPPSLVLDLPQWVKDLQIHMVASPKPTASPSPVRSRVPRAKFRFPTSQPIALTDHTAEVQTLAISPDSNTLVSGSRDKTIKIWNLATGTLQGTLKGHSGSVRAIAISPNGQTIVSASQDRTIALWDLDTGTRKNTLRGHNGSVYAIAISPDGQTIVSGSADNTLKIWNLTTGQVQATLRGHSDVVRAVAISPNGQTIVSGSADNTIKIWNLTTGEVQRTLRGHLDLVRAVAISPDGKTLVSGSWDETIKIWNLPTRELSYTLRGHKDKVTSLAFSPDGQTLVTGSDDNTIKIWNLFAGVENPDYGKVQDTLEGHSSDVFSVAISPDGNTLVSAGWDKTIKIWR